MVPQPVLALVFLFDLNSEVLCTSYCQMPNADKGVPNRCSLSPFDGLDSAGKRKEQWRVWGAGISILLGFSY